MVVGVTNEPESLVTRTMEEVGMEFPVARVKGESIDDAYGIRGFPSAFLIDPRGRIAWAGHPGNLDESLIERQFGSVVYAAPLADKRYAKINAALAKRELGKAHAAIEKALADAPGDAALQGALKSLQDGARILAEEAAAHAKSGRYGFAAELYAEVAKVFDGLPQAGQAKAALEALEELPEAEDELAAYELLAEARAALVAGDRTKARAKLAQAVKRDQTPSGSDARRLAASIGS